MAQVSATAGIGYVPPNRSKKVQPNVPFDEKMRCPKISKMAS